MCAHGNEPYLCRFSKPENKPGLRGFRKSSLRGCAAWEARQAPGGLHSRRWDLGTSAHAPARPPGPRPRPPGPRPRAPLGPASACHRPRLLLAARPDIKEVSAESRVLCPSPGPRAGGGVPQARAMADAGGWRVSPGPRGVRRAPDPRPLPRRARGWVPGGGAGPLAQASCRRSRRAPARPTAPSGRSAAAPDTSCTTTTSTASGPPASSGGGTWPAAGSGRSAAAPRPRCGGARGSAGGAGALTAPSPPSGPRPLERSRPGSLLRLCFLSFEKYQKLVHQQGFTVKKGGECREFWGRKKRDPLTVLVSAALRRRWYF